MGLALVDDFQVTEAVVVGVAVFATREPGLAGVDRLGKSLHRFGTEGRRGEVHLVSMVAVVAVTAPEGEAFVGVAQFHVVGIMVASGTTSCASDG